MFKNNKFFAFTLAELLIAMTVVGVISVLVIPGLIRGLNAKSNMSKLKNTVTYISNAVSKDITESGSDYIKNTTIYKNPQDFLNTQFEHSRGSAFAGEYKSRSGADAFFYIPENSVLLKNGAGVGIINDDENKNSIIVIDVNGPKTPNMVGVDYYYLYLAWEDDVDNAVHMGDVGSLMDDEYSQMTKAQLKNACLSASDKDGRACYKLVELSGFDPEYLSKNY